MPEFRRCRDRPPDERDNAEVRIAAGEYPIDKELDIL
jgi:hypothetical protein